ncbi:MAG TPA: TonB family protein [Pseudolabrys sp.]|nr:TonB family protein [Pseudolabrys sp.]
MSENRFLYQFCSILGAATLVCGTHLFLLATWNWDSATDVEPVTPAVTISIELSNRNRPLEPVAELIAKDQLAGSSARQVALASSVEQLHTSSETPRFTVPTEKQVQVALEDRPHVTAEAHMRDQTPPASASANVSVAQEEQPLITADARMGDPTPPAPVSANASVTLEEQPPITAEARVGNQAEPASASANVSVAREEQPLVTADARIGKQIQPASAIGSVSVALEEQPPTAEALVGGQPLLFSASANGPVSAEPATKDNAADSGSAPDVTPSSSAETAEGGDKSADSTPMQEDAAVPGGESQISQPLLAASSPQKAEAAEPQRPETGDNSSVAQETIRPVLDATQSQDSEQVEDTIQTGSIATAVPNPQQSSLKALLRKGMLKPSTDQARPKLAANPKPAPKLAAKATQHEQTSEVRPRRKPMGSASADKPSLSLTQSQPKRRDAVIAGKEKPALKMATKPNPRHTESSQITPRWKPMALAPADKPSLSLTHSQPKKPEARGYSANIWSALARRKPNAGQRGSTTVTFAIGPAGALRFVRVSQSSGNARLDQLALATVRAAAPFPPPPVLKDGTPAYTIRIDFH